VFGILLVASAIVFSISLFMTHAVFTLLSIDISLGAKIAITCCAMIAVGVLLVDRNPIAVKQEAPPEIAPKQPPLQTVAERKDLR